VSLANSDTSTVPVLVLALESVRLLFVVVVVNSKSAVRVVDKRPSDSYLNNRPGWMKWGGYKQLPVEFGVQLQSVEVEHNSAVN